MLNKLFKNSNKNIEELSIKTVIAGGVSITGNIKGDQTIRIDGNVDGNIEMTEGIILGEKSFIKGSLYSDSVVVYGKLNGDISCKVLYIKNTGIIDGDITTGSIEVDMGGRYNGTLRMDMVAEITDFDTITMESAGNI
jgi:cytoskeletal protein CcmA (bactofilin family)